MAINAWVAAVCETWLLADEAWQAEAEAAALGYDTELAEFAELHPRPTLKEAMLALAGRRCDIDDIESEAA